MHDIPVIEMVHPMPGFAGLRRFALVELDEGGVLCALRSLDDDVRFLVVPPVSFFPDYAPEIHDDTAAALDLSSDDDALLLLVLNAGPTLEETTANLAAPIVVNTRTRRACQAVLDDADLSVRAALLA